MLIQAILVRIILPFLTLSYTNVKLLTLLLERKKKSEPQNEDNQVIIMIHSFWIPTFLKIQHHVYTLLAIVLLFLLCNLLRPILMAWDIVTFETVTPCQIFNSKNHINFHNIGRTTANLIVTNICRSKIFTYIPNTYSYLLSANFLLVINSSLNFILYVMLSPKFQLKVKKMWAAISSRESDVQDTNIFFVTE